MWQHYKTRQKPNISALERLQKDNDSEYTDKTGNKIQEIFLETQMGTLVDCIDEVDEEINNNVCHCVVLSYEY